MKYTYDEIDLLAEILEAEIANHPVDPGLASDLALKLAELCPDIAMTMARVANRHRDVTDR